MSESESQYPDASVQSESGPVVVRQSNSRLKSEAWNHFNKLGAKAVCRHCGMQFAMGPKSGTTHLRRHIKDACEKISEEERENFGLGKEREIPFAVIENRFFEATMRSLRPEFKAVGRQTLRNDCVEVYKKRLAVSLKEFEELDSCVSFTADIWTSSVNLGYLCLTAHYIDKNFNFKKKIIGFRQMPYPHSGPAVASLIEKILVEWKLDAKIFTITLDNSTVNGNAIESIEEKFGYNSIFGGEHMHMRCAAHVLNIMVQDGMKIISEALKKIREILRRIASSGKRLQFFNDILKELHLGEKKGVTLDCPTRWNSTYVMIKEALKFKHALLRFGEDSLLEVPSSDEWKEAEELAKFLEVFFYATKTFSTVRQPCSHLYMKEVWTIRAMLLEDYMSFSQTLQNLAQKMLPKFNKILGKPELDTHISLCF